MGKDIKASFVFLVAGILVAGILASSSFHDDATGAAIRSSSRTTLPSSTNSLLSQEILPTSETSTNPIENINENSNRRSSVITAPKITNENIIPDSFDSTSQGYQKSPQKKVEYTKGNLIVQFKENPSFTEESRYLSTSLDSINKLNDKYTVSAIYELFPNSEAQFLKNTYLLVFSGDKSVEEAIVDYEQDSNILYAEHNFLAETSATVQQAIPPPNDPLYSQQWYLPKIESSQAWASITNITNLSSAPVIAVIDTGVQWNHQDLANNIWINTGEIPNNNLDDDTNGFIDDVRGWDFVETIHPCYAGEDCSVEDNDPNDFQGHGTHVAGIAGAVTNNNLGVAGVCANFCKIMPVRAGFAYVSGEGLLEYDDIAQSLVYAADNGANVVSMSFGGMNSNLMQNAINYAYNRGVVLVAAAGNSGDNFPLMAYPAALSNVIAVGATDQNDMQTRFSNFGAWVDIAAPGLDIFSTISPTSPMNSNPQNPPYCANANECYLQLSGTSMAAPVISGVVGLLLAKNPALTQNEVLTIIHSSHDPIDHPAFYLGLGRTNLFKTVSNSNGGIVASLDPQLDHSAHGPQSFNILGNANGQNFLKYKIEIGSYNAYPTLWQIVQADTFTPVNNAILGALNPLSLNLQPDIYSLRLLVTDTNQKTWEDRTVLLIDSTLVRGWPKIIPDYSDSPIIPVDIDGNNNQELFFNALRMPLMNNLFYALDNTGLPLNNWPILNTAPYGWFITQPGLPSPAVSNIDNDPAMEAIYSVPYSNSVKVYAYETNGNLQNGWPILLPSTLSTWSMKQPPVIANVDGGNDKEVIFISMDYFNNCGLSQNKIYIYKQDGTILPGWPQSINCPPIDPAVGDVDGNGDMEIVVSSPFAYHQNQELYVFNHDGTLLPGWPQIVAGGSSSPVLADLDQNDGGKLEIVQFGINGTLYVLNDDGSLVQGWPQQYSAIIGATFSHSPAIADVDNNGDLEIIFEDGYSYSLYVVNHDGTTLTGWPVTSFGWDASPIIVDLDGDGFKEIVSSAWNTGAYSLEGFRYDGTTFPGFPKRVMYFAPSYAAGDINGNGIIDIVALDYFGSIHLWEFTGRATPQNLPWPMTRHDAQNTGKY